MWWRYQSQKSKLEAYIEMSWNTLAGVVGVKEVACRAGDPSWAVAGAR